MFGTNRLLRNVTGLWVLQECRRQWQRDGVPLSYAEIVARAGDAPAGGSHVDIDHPEFLALGDMPARIRAYCRRTGQREPQGVAEIARCVLESLALRYRTALSAVGEVTGRPVPLVHVVGGGARNALLNQLTADVTGLPVQAGPVETTALGNALVQLVAGELVDLTRRLGDPAADLVVLAEGNTSTRLDGDRFAAKASGARMDAAEAEHFVVGELAELLAVLDGGTADQRTLTELLSAGGARASIETLVHVAALAAGATWVAHTHPTAVVGLLAVAGAEELWAAPLFPDEAVVLGEPVWVPYAAPGLALGQAVHAAIRERCERDGVPPRLVLLGNHGIVALGATATEVETVTTMAVKAARVRGGALAAGTPVPLDRTHARELAGRPDEAARRTMLGRSPGRSPEV